MTLRLILLWDAISGALESVEYPLIIMMVCDSTFLSLSLAIHCSWYIQCPHRAYESKFLLVGLHWCVHWKDTYEFILTSISEFSMLCLIAIIPRSTLTRVVILVSFIYRSNGFVWKLLILDRITWNNVAVCKEIIDFSLVYLTAYQLLMSGQNLIWEIRQKRRGLLLNRINVR